MSQNIWPTLLTPLIREKQKKPKREIWLHERCTQLKHETKAVEELISEMEKLAKKTSLTKTIKENFAGGTYFINHRHMMDYATHIEKNLPIGSGVIVAQKSSVL